MDKSFDEKEFRKALKAELFPPLLGLRNELKKVVGLLDLIFKKEIPDIQKVELTNEKDTPEVQKVDLIDKKINIGNFPPPQEEVKIKGAGEFFTKHFDTFSRITEGVANLPLAFGKKIEEISKKIFKVEITNQKEYPKEIKVSNLAEIKQEPIEIPTSVSIRNSEPSEAIPVVLTDHQKKSFYEVINQLVGLTDINLADVKRLLQEISTNTADINIDIDTLNIDLDQVEVLLGKDTKHRFGEVSVAGSTETELASFTVPVGKTLYIKSVYGEGIDDGLFRLYVASAKKWQMRNAWTQRNVKTNLEIIANAGETISLKVLNLKPVATNFSGGFYGYEL